ncbi:MAG: hypothetical protein IJW46_03020 [Clostridia bacterium]|nr:hypothetical protein [Clostridia bacterium]
MKKAISLLLILSCLLVFCSCASTPDTSSANKIVYGEKYIAVEDAALPAEEQSYYIFEKDYVTRYEYYKDTVFSNSTSHYALTYKYEVMSEGTLAYFYDRVVIYEDDTVNTQEKFNKRNGILLFSENVIATTDEDLYVRESYLENELEYFGK